MGLTAIESVATTLALSRTVRISARPTFLLAADPDVDGHDGGVTETESLAAGLRPLTPLRIRAVEYESPILVVIGDGWSLALLGSWAWRRDGVVVTEWGEPDASDAVWDLCGLDVLAVRFPNVSSLGDCSFELSDGGSLEARSDQSGYDTWTFRHDDLDVVFVGQ